MSIRVKGELKVENRLWEDRFDTERGLWKSFDGDVGLSSYFSEVQRFSTELDRVQGCYDRVSLTLKTILNVWQGQRCGRMCALPNFRRQLRTEVRRQRRVLEDGYHQACEIAKKLSMKSSTLREDFEVESERLVALRVGLEGRENQIVAWKTAVVQSSMSFQECIEETSQEKSQVSPLSKPLQMVLDQLLCERLPTLARISEISMRQLMQNSLELAHEVDCLSAFQIHSFSIDCEVEVQRDSSRHLSSFDFPAAYPPPPDHPQRTCQLPDGVKVTLSGTGDVEDDHLLITAHLTNGNSRPLQVGGCFFTCRGAVLRRYHFDVNLRPGTPSTRPGKVTITVKSPLPCTLRRAKYSVVVDWMLQ